jgi:hypothetical protein
VRARFAGPHRFGRINGGEAGYTKPMDELAGPIPERVTSDLEALKLRLFDMRAEELPTEQAAALSREISAIRLHLKRLALEREQLQS